MKQVKPNIDLNDYFCLQPFTYSEFHRNAYSDTQSFFKSKNTTIISEGFDIYDKGNKIIFYGNSSVKIK